MIIGPYAAATGDSRTRQYEGRLLLSPADPNAFLGCHHASALTRRVLDGEAHRASPPRSRRSRPMGMGGPLVWQLPLPRQFRS